MMASYTDTDTSQDNTTAESDFETDLAIIGYKIETYFSSLIDLIAKRRNDLLSELDEVLTEFLEEKRKIEERRRELEQMLRYHEDKCFSTNVRELQDSFLSQIRNELSEVSNHKSKKTIRFEWNPKYVREASKIGILHVSSENDTLSYPDDTLYNESNAENSWVDVPSLHFKSIPNKGDKWIDDLNPRLSTVNFRLESTAEDSFIKGPMNSQDFPDERPSAYTSAYFDSQAKVELPMSRAKRNSQDFNSEGPKKKPKPQLITEKNEQYWRSQSICTHTYILNPMQSYADFKVFEENWGSQSRDKLVMEIPFSGRLLSSLYYMTDVGPIPRGFKPGETLAPTFYSSPNWKRSIQGCYWCCRDNASHQAICCSTKCLLYLHEWCVFKVNDSKRTDFICRYPGCNQANSSEKNSFCTDEHASAFHKDSSGLLDPSTDFSIIKIGPKWYNVDPQFNSIQFSNNFSKKGTSTSYSSGQMKSVCSDVMVQGTEASLFIFSPRLYKGLISCTDIGPIPRDSKCHSHLSSPFATCSNWCETIEGCYWCGKQLIKDNKYLYVCDKKCYSLLHEWCRRKYQHATGDSICSYPGCDQFIVNNEFCSEEHLQKLEADYKTIYNSRASGLNKDPPWYKKSNATSSIPQSESGTNLPSLQQPQIPFLLSRVLSEFLIFQTDIGPIPRELIQYAGEIHIRPQVLQPPSNWNIAIPGCYWCCNSPINPYNQLFCSLECFYLFNEWCYNKYKQGTGGSCCKYLSCETNTHSSSNCCHHHLTLYASEFGKFSHLLTSTQFILGPKWYNNHSLEVIDFYNRDEPFYEFTNFFPCNSLLIDGVYFPTSEHYFQSQKFVGTPYTKFVSQLSAPRDALDFGRKKEVTRWMRPDWNTMREHVMYRVLKEKFTQIPELRELLINTCNAVLYEHTSNDSFWGDGGNRTGQNKLGHLLMKLRSELQPLLTYFPTTLQHHSFLSQNNNNSNQIPQNNFPTADGSDEWIDDVKPHLTDNPNQCLKTINFRLEATTRGTFMKSLTGHHDVSSVRDDRPPAYNPAFPNQPSPGSAVMDCNEPTADDTMDTASHVS